MSRTESKIRPSGSRAENARRSRSQQSAGAKAKPAASDSKNQSANEASLRLGVAAVCLVAGLLVYWRTLLGLVWTWWSQPDYSHGFLVIPFAIVFLWLRRASFPGLKATSPVLAATFLAMSLGLRFAGAKYFFSFMDGWSILPWVAAVVAAIGGWPLLRWSLPSIGFLIFMVPLPFRVEGELSAPLQKIATKLSTAGLQLLGQPAFNEGNNIWLNDEPQPLNIAEACSGLKTFFGMLALTYGYLAIIRREWWEKLLLILAALPITIIANSTRIVIIGLTHSFTHNQHIREWVHSANGGGIAGWMMIALAAGMFSFLLWYLKQLIYEEEIVDISTLVREAKVSTSAPGV